MDCPVCTSSQIKPNVTFIENIWNKNYPVNYCQDCDLYFLSDWPSSKEINDFYSRSYHQYSFFQFKLKSVFREFRSQSQFHFIDHFLDWKLNRVMEIGAADARLLRLFKKKDINIYGTEFNKKMLEFAKSKYGIEMDNKDLFDVEGKFDLIMLSHVIEHFVNLDEVLSKIKSLLNEDGFVFIEVPNSPVFLEDRVQLIKEYCNTPHIYNFTEKSLKILFEKHNFKIITSRRYNYHHPFSYSKDTKDQIAYTFLTGKLNSLKLLLPAFIFLLFNFFNKKKSFEEVTDPHWGDFGDNIRIIAKL